MAISCIYYYITIKQLTSCSKRIETEFKMEDETFVGLPNFGNTCYMNASIKAFAASRRFRSLLYEECAQTGSVLNEDELVQYMWRRLVLLLIDNDKGAISKANVAFGLLDLYTTAGVCFDHVHGNQEDAHEFLSSTLNFFCKSMRRFHSPSMMYAPTSVVLYITNTFPATTSFS